MPRLLLLALSFLLIGTLTAQDLFTIKIGTFRDVKASDFTTLQGKGFLYGAPGADQTIDVYLGQFTDQTKANAIATDLQSNGFRNARTYSLPTSTGQTVTVIQIALQAGNRPIDWATMERAGQLYVEAVDGTNKIVTGIYPDARTAANFLPAIRALGYSDAFVKTVNNVRLIPITGFETGIKKPLIPINMEAGKAAAQAKQPAGNPAPTPAPGTYGASSPKSAEPYSGPATNTSVAYDPGAGPTTTTPTLPNPANAKTVPLPAIDGKTKRHSSAELQRVLKEKGYYEGSIDGLYGPGTAAAYLSAWDDMPEIRKYRKLSEIALEPTGSRDLISKWPEVNTLLAVAEDLSAGLGNDTRARQLVQQRAQLAGARQALSPVANERVKNWAGTLWTNMDQWATEDPLHAQIHSAFRVTYHQSQVRLEDHYMDLGLGATEARDLATAMLQNLVGAQLDRFL